MKKILLSLGVVLSLGLSMLYTVSTTTATVSDEFYDEVFPWMMENSLTKFTDVDDFRPADSITRAEASKFVVSYAGLIDLEREDNACNFRDTVGFDASLLPYIQDACEYGLFRGNNGNFLPKNSITEAEALVVIMRSLEGMMDESGSPWYGAYYDRAYDLGIISDEDIDAIGSMKITREKLGTWLYRGYNSDALEDTIVYETEVDGPSDCSSYEKYDSKRMVCSYQCIDEAECQTIQDQIDTELGTWASDLDGATREAPKYEDAPTQGTLVVYSVDPRENITLRSGKDAPEYQSLWKEVAELSPDNLSEKYIDTFEIYSDAKSDVIAFVVDEDGDGKWKVSVNLPVHKSSDLKEQKSTIIHELGHIIMLNTAQMTTPSGACPNYEVSEGCTKASAYLNNFVKKFWGNTTTANFTESTFVSEYASTDAVEDIAESFAFYVLGSNHSDATVKNQKMNFFNAYPEIVKIREDMRKILASDILRAKKAQ